MGLGGRKTEETTLPKFYETALQQQIGTAQDAAATGYVPYYGPDVAAFTPMQNAAFQNTDMMAGAFGMPGTGGNTGMPAPTEFAGGVMGYSSQPLYQESVDMLQENRPAQYDYINSFVIDPVTGELGANAAQNQPVALEMSAGSKRGK